MITSLPEILYLWAWSPAYVSLMNRSERRMESGIILPGSATEQIDVAPYAAHFARLQDGDEVDWLWLFEKKEAAVSLRMLPRVASADKYPEVDLIRSTLPWNAPDKPAMTYLQAAPIAWFKNWEKETLEAQGFKEVWMGFDYPRYAKDMTLRSAVDRILNLDEWYELLR